MANLHNISGSLPVYEDFARCVHCGLCLNDCPTYRLWHLEGDSPRGRIRQMVMVEQGELGVSEGYVDHIDKCLACRACETACPSGVQYGKLVEHARARIENEYKRPFFTRVARDMVFKKLLPFPGRIRFAANLLGFYQRSGLQTLARGSGILMVLGLAERERLLPKIDADYFYRELGKTFPAVGAKRARVAFFAGCIANVTFTRLNEATIRVLTANGCDVVVPGEQLCCGALAAHAGVREIARDLARKNIAAFKNGQFDAVVTNAAGCGSTLKEYDHLFSADEPEYADAAAFSKNMRDVTEFLATLGLSAAMKPLPVRVTYQDSCHLLHGQKVREAPRKLLQAMPAVELVELPYADICCGSAGVYNVTQTEASMELLGEKMANAKKTGAAIIVTANPGCLLQMRAGAEIYKTGQEIVHVVELLDRAMGTRGSASINQ
ncbi:MAG TPA: (Fe-S)-binding protein [Candidatus Acidoferrum sp.]